MGHAGAYGWLTWRRVRPAPPTGGSRLDLGHLLGIGSGIAVASFVVRVWFPLGSSQYGELHLSQWPQYVALFSLGIAAGRRGWLDPVPGKLRRHCGAVALAAALAIGAFAVIVASVDVPAEEFLGGGRGRPSVWRSPKAFWQ